MIATIDLWQLVQNITNAQLIVHSYAGHGEQFQYPDTFLKHAIQFLANHDRKRRKKTNDPEYNLPAL